MSTEHQRYSIQNQAAVIAAYARAHNLTIVRTYADPGESGLIIKNRPALIRLLQDVRRGRADFGHILVFDVSRWGRFQDIDESAHYEFICKRAGIKVAYCAEQFDNDGSLISSIVKNLKRVMAAEYSRELSVKVHAGACRLVGLGFKQGGPISYALRRELVDENMQAKGLLSKGERKYLHSDHVRVRLGPPDEVATVRWIFEQFVVHGSEIEIARRLNQRGIPNKNGHRWNRVMVHFILKNESYIGNIVYNRRSRHLKQKWVNNPENMWVRSVGAFEPIIEPSLFLRAQKIMEERRVSLPKDQMLARLSAALKKHGRLTGKIINETVGLPCSATYMDHFGTLRNAYRLIGYTTERNCKWLDSHRHWSEVIAALASKIAKAIEKAGGRADVNSEADCLLVNRACGLSFRIARSWPGRKESHSPRWAFHRRRHLLPGWIIAIRLAKDNEAVLDYLLFPTSKVSIPMIRFTEKARTRFKTQRFETADALVRSITRRVISASRASPTKAVRSKTGPTRGRSKGRLAARQHAENR
jgi:DNA invertase Pin-like site-specific DNA recombinase